LALPAEWPNSRRISSVDPYCPLENGETHKPKGTGRLRAPRA
jgi:hypothetical protein